MPLFRNILVLVITLFSLQISFAKKYSIKTNSYYGKNSDGKKSLVIFLYEEAKNKPNKLIETDTILYDSLLHSFEIQAHIFYLKQADFISIYNISEENGKLMIKKYGEKYTAISEGYDVVRSKIFGFAKKEKKWGIISHLGETIYPFEIDSFFLEKKDDMLYRYASIYKNGKCAIYRFGNEWRRITDYRYDKIYIENLAWDHYAFADSSDKRTIIFFDAKNKFKNARELFPLIYKPEETFNHSRYFSIMDYLKNILQSYTMKIKQNGKIGLIDIKTGKILIPCEYDSIYDGFSNYLVFKDNKKGLYTRFPEVIKGNNIRKNHFVSKTFISGLPLKMIFECKYDTIIYYENRYNTGQLTIEINDIINKQGEAKKNELIYIKTENEFYLSYLHRRVYRRNHRHYRRTIVVKAISEK